MAEKKDGLKILVIQIARMGDILQSTPVLFGLRQKFPKSKIDVLVRKSFSGVLENNPFINKLITVDSCFILDNLLQRKGSLVESTSRLKDLVSELSDTKYDLVYNLSFSLSSSYLTYLINAKKTVGLTRSADGFYTVKGDWGKYFTANVLKQGLNTKHIVDIFRGMCEVEDKDTSLYMHVSLSEKTWVNNEFTKQGLLSSHKVVALQPGASRASKRWPAKYFAKLIDKLSINNPDLKFIILGSAKEKFLAEEIKLASINTNIFDFTGKTNLGQLAALLARCELLVSNDTGTLHIATAQDVPVVCISIGASNIYETGPYSYSANYSVVPKLSCYPCNYSIICNDMKCKTMIPVEIIEKLSASLLFKDTLMFKNEDARYGVFKGEILDNKTCSGKKYSAIRFLPLEGRIANTHAIISAIYKSLWDNVFSDFNHGSLEFETLPDDATIKELRLVVELLEKLYHLTDVGIRYSELLIKELGNKNLILENVKGLSAKLQVVDENIEKLGEVSEYVLPLINKFKVDKECLEPTELSILAEQTKGFYADLATYTQYVFQILIQVVGEKATLTGVVKDKTEKEVGAL